MSFYKFHDDDLFVNTIQAEPNYSFYIYSGSIYIDNLPHMTETKAGNSNANIHGVPNGFISLYGYNIDRKDGERIYPFVYKDGKRNSFKTISKKDYDTQYVAGDQVTSSYNMSASISREYYNSLGFTNRKRIYALQNTLNHYSYMSPHYVVSSSLGNKLTQNLNLISIPSIFYGSEIKRGSVKLSFYISGSLIGKLTDSRRNGELVQESGSNPANDGKVAGVVLYKEGFIVLSGSWNISNNNTQNYRYGHNPTISDKQKWIYWGAGANDGNSGMFSGNPNLTQLAVSSSFLMEYVGNNKTQTLTMLAHAPYNELNHSNNPTFLSSSAENMLKIKSAHTGAHQYVESPPLIKNVVSASYTDQAPPFEKTTYITKIAVYDEHKNLIGVAKLAKPVRKTEDNNFTFKIKLDI